MGSLTLPAGGRVSLDAQVVIYSVEKRPPYAALLQPMWAAAKAGLIELVTSEMSVLEVLVGPYKSGDARLEQEFEDLFAHRRVTLEPITPDILRAAAKLRAAVPKLRTPDAIHAATAQAAGCTLFVTNDAAFRSVPGLTVAVLQDVLAAP